MPAIQDTLWHIWGYARDVIVHRRHCSYAHCDTWGFVLFSCFFPLLVLCGHACVSVFWVWLGDDHLVERHTWWQSSSAPGFKMWAFLISHIHMIDNLLPTTFSSITLVTLVSFVFRTKLFLFFPFLKISAPCVFLCYPEDISWSASCFSSRLPAHAQSESKNRLSTLYHLQSILCV